MPLSKEKHSARPGRCTEPLVSSASAIGHDGNVWGRDAALDGREPFDQESPVAPSVGVARSSWCVELTVEPFNIHDVGCVVKPGPRRRSNTSVVRDDQVTGDSPCLLGAQPVKVG